MHSIASSVRAQFHESGARKIHAQLPQIRMQPQREWLSATGRSASTIDKSAVDQMDKVDTRYTPLKTPIEDDLTFERQIGQGAFARVFLATTKKSDFAVAVKIMKKSENPYCMQEIEMMHRVSHEFVMPLLATYQTEEEMMLVTPYYSGCDLFDYIEQTYESGNQIPEQDALVLAAQMLSAAEALHRAGVVHLDIKPENFMFASKEMGSDLVLVDFGSAEPMKLVSYADTMERYDPRLDDQLPLERLNRVTGTANYLSPEVADGRFSSRSDVFSVGVCLYTLLTGLCPFANEDVCDRKDHIRAVAKRADFECEDWERVSQDSIDVCKWMLRPDPQLRCSTTEALVALETCLHIQKANELRMRAFGRFERTRQQSISFRQSLLDTTGETSESPYHSAQRAASRILDDAPTRQESGPYHSPDRAASRILDLARESANQPEVDSLWEKVTPVNALEDAVSQAESRWEDALSQAQSSCQQRREKTLEMINSDLNDAANSR